jgi:sodium transport system permease protein
LLNQILVIAEKEIKDAGRDTRSLISSLFYALMGPLIVSLVAFATQSSGKPGQGASVLIAMISIFALVSPFSGGMNIAMDTVSGERERQSLLPLLLNPVPRTNILLGKWLAVTLFSVAGLVINLSGVFLVLLLVNMRVPFFSTNFLIPLVVGILPLSLLAASAELLISTVCRTAKEAHTYLSLVVFVPMVTGMFVVFFPVARQMWSAFVPVAGQQLQLEALLTGRSIALVQPVVLGCLTAVAALGILLFAGRNLQRDEIVYGN